MSDKAMRPEDLTRLFVERANAGDVDGMVELYEPDAVLAFPPGSETVGHAALRDLFAEMVKNLPEFKQEPTLPTVRNGDLAITSTVPSDNTGGRVQVVRRQPDGSWRRIIDRPEIRSAR
ncbi:YybH family protein [Fodinicola acaciae]|uniref:YybH family protein n=1 Tax=Fodinicola acaciae TaxID=2681555 RepID=UPI0013D68C23|nr:nuclear transport factor 2 family protein [Fodinicola acaciae]